MSRDIAPTLPTEWYIDADHFRREQILVWGRNWVCIGREEEWPAAHDFRVVDVAGQQLVVLRDRKGALRAFLNTCRHRGSRLCEKDSGRLPGGRLVCPYHALTYDSDGRLMRAPGSEQCSDFDPLRFALYDVSLGAWGGFVFVHLGDPPHAPLADAMAEEDDTVAAWPLADLRVVQREDHDIECNWKIFWENFSECYHCPGVHPDLCALVPAYARGEMSEADGPARLRAGAETWSADGTTWLPPLPGLGPAQQQAGMTFATFWPSMFLVAHVDYVRSVRVTPIGPRRTQLTVEWLLDASTPKLGAAELERLCEFGRQVVLEDARVCVLNQQGLNNRRHRGGILMPGEKGVLEFDDWVRTQLEAPEGATDNRNHSSATK